MTSVFIPLLAAGGGSVIFAIVLIISVISWIVNLIQSNKPKGKPANRPRPNNQAQTELERFLREVVGGPQAEPEKKRPKPARPEKRGGKPKPPPAKPAAEKRPAVERPGAKMAQTRLPTSDLGQAVRSAHLETSAERGVADTVQRDIVEAVQRDIGTDGTIIAAQRGAVHPLVQALRTPQGARQAILLSEILKRPRSLR